jgi:hypothetical protein
MRRRWPLLVLASIASGCAPAKEVPSVKRKPEGTLTVTASCRNADPCVWRGGDLFVDIQVANAGTRPVSFPLAYLQKTGPSIRLVHARTGEETQLRRNLAPEALRDELTVLAPGQSVVIAWVIHDSELVQLGEEVDLTAEILLFGEARVEGQPLEFEAGDSLRIRRK